VSVPCQPDTTRRPRSPVAAWTFRAPPSFREKVERASGLLAVCADCLRPQIGFAVCTIGKLGLLLSEVPISISSLLPMVSPGRAKPSSPGDSTWASEAKEPIRRWRRGSAVLVFPWSHGWGMIFLGPHHSKPCLAGHRYQPGLAHAGCVQRCSANLRRQCRTKPYHRREGCEPPLRHRPPCAVACGTAHAPPPSARNESRFLPLMRASNCVLEAEEVAFADD